jgi:hypothetical protein
LTRTKADFGSEIKKMISEPILMIESVYVVYVTSGREACECVTSLIAVCKCEEHAKKTLLRYLFENDYILNFVYDKLVFGENGEDVEIFRKFDNFEERWATVKDKSDFSRAFKDNVANLDFATYVNPLHPNCWGFYDDDCWNYEIKKMLVE